MSLLYCRPPPAIAVSCFSFFVCYGFYSGATPVVTTKIDTTAISITDVQDRLLDSGINLNADITQVHHENWVEHRPIGDLSHSVYVHQVPQLIATHALNPDLWGHTLCLLGPTAIGKTEGVRQGLEQAADTMRRTLNLTELHVSQMGPVDALGVPREENKQTYWAPPKIWPLAVNEQERTGHQDRVQLFLDGYRREGTLAYDLLPQDWFVHFHDEVTNPASPQVPHQLFPAWCGDSHGRMIGGHRLVRDYFVVLAGNRVQDGTNSINLASSAVTRLGLIEVVPHFGGWLQNYAFRQRMVAGKPSSQIHPAIIAYLNKFNRHFAPQELDERSPMDPFPTPRNWTYVSDLFYAHQTSALPDELFRAAVAGRIGDATARELFTFLSYYSELPDVDKLLRGEPVPNFPAKNRIDLLAILGTQMVVQLNAKNAKVFMQYINDDTKFPPEVAAMTMKQLRPAGKLRDLASTWAKPEFAQFTANFKRYTI